MRDLCLLISLTAWIPMPLQAAAPHHGPAQTFLNDAYREDESIGTARTCEAISQQYPISETNQKQEQNLQKRWQEIQWRYKELSKKLKKNINPLWIKVSVARRFINKSDWELEVSKNKNQASPNNPYGSDSWGNWAETYEQQILPATSPWKPTPTVTTLLKWNKGALLGLLPDHIKVGKLKESTNYGKNVKEIDALSNEEISSLKSLGLKFTPLICQEKLAEQSAEWLNTPSCQAMKTKALQESMNPKNTEWLKVQSELSAKTLSKDTLLTRWFWFACWPRAKMPKSKNEKVCGMFEYPTPEVASRELAGLMREAKLFEVCARKGNIDRLTYVLNFQRRMVALHPFNKGNGRVSRWTMDTLGLRQGFPPLLVENMNKDLSTPLTEHKKIALKETFDDLNRLESCLKEYEKNGFEKTQNTLCGLDR